MVSVDKRSTPKGAPRWLVRWRDDAGKSRARTFRTKRAADEFRATIALQLATDGAPDESRRRATVGDAYKHWVNAHPEWARTTRTRYESTWTTHVEARWGEVQVRKVRRQDVQDWLLGIPRSRATRKKILVVLSGALGQAASDRWISANVALDVRLPAEGVPTRRPYLTRQQIADFSTAAEEIAGPSWSAGTIVNTLAHTGLRFGELAGLQVADVNPAKRYLEIRRSLTEENGNLIEGPPKSGKTRRVYVPLWLMEEIIPLTRDKTPDCEVFTTPRGSVLRVRNVRRSWWNSAVRKSWDLARQREQDEARQTRQKLESFGLPIENPVESDPKKDAAIREEWAKRITPHVLRHTAASLAISEGLTVMQVQRMLGHSKPSITLDTYSDLFDDDSINGAARLQSAHEAWVAARQRQAEEAADFAQELDAAREYMRHRSSDELGF